MIKSKVVTERQVMERLVATELQRLRSLIRDEHLSAYGNCKINQTCSFSAIHFKPDKYLPSQFLKNIIFKGYAVTYYVTKGEFKIWLP